MAHIRTIKPGFFTSLVAAGVVPDDTAEFVTEEMPRIVHDGGDRWRLDLHVSGDLKEAA